eukprot:c15445_g1_i1 orf=222-866(+)
MEMDFAYSRPGSAKGYEAQRPIYRPSYDRSGLAYGPSSSSFYPKVAQPIGHPIGRSHPPLPVSSASSGLGIRVALKPEYRVAPPPQLLPQPGEVPHSSFQFDFDLERRILEEAEKESQLWNRGPSTNQNHFRSGQSNASSGLVEDPVVSKYVAMGLSKEAVVMAVATFGDVQAKVVEFVPSYNLLREMGFPSDAVAGALAMYDNDKERALAHLV